MRSYILLAIIAALLFAGDDFISSFASRISSANGQLISSSNSLSTSSSFIRLRANKLRKPELCRDNLPRRSEDLPALVIVGRVRDVYLAALGGSIDSLATSNDNKALVNVGRVIKGNEQLVGSDIVIIGFNSSSSTGSTGQFSCPNYVKPNDTLILLLNPIPPLNSNRYSIHNNNLLSLNLANLDRINALAADELYKRRPPIEDILCEAHYCPYGRCQVNERTNQTSCQCPDSCTPLQSPVCGSDNATYTNECYLIREGCARKRPLFVTKEAPC